MPILQHIASLLGILIVLAVNGAATLYKNQSPAPEPYLETSVEIASSSSDSPVVTATSGTVINNTSSTKKVASTSSSQQVAPPANPGAARAAINVPLKDQAKLLNSTVAIVCVRPQTAATDPAVYSGTGVIVNTSGYILTNAHVLADSKYCYVGRKHTVPEGFQSRRALPTIALYYSLELVGKGIQETPDATEKDWGASSHDFAIFKIGEKLPREYYRAYHAPAEIRALNDTFIPWATDQEYATFPQSGPFPAIALDLEYQPMVGDWLSLGGYIGSNINPDYVFAAGRLVKINPAEIIIEMPTGQGLSGSAVVDDRGRMIALSHATNCNFSGGCTAITEGDDLAYLYGNNSVAVPLPALDKAMKADIGFGLTELQAKR